MSDGALINRVASSGLITIKLEEFYPEAELLALDLKGFLFMELMLKEKDFREAMKAHDWAQYAGKILCVHCSSDAIIPVWAYMLVASYAQPHALRVVQGDRDMALRLHFSERVAQIDPQAYAGQRLVIKGCSDRPVPPSAYLDLTARLLPVAKSIMFGEPCSTVPVYKQSKA